MATIDIIKDLLQTHLGIDPDLVDEESTFDSLDIDSLDMVELIVELEEQLDVEIGEPDNIDTVADLIDYLEELQNS
ncbi:MAG: acyl carrier protein [Eggerthellaceae bacterium]|nr:acyl carrier protein [Eggerthellaceae bacterium]